MRHNSLVSNLRPEFPAFLASASLAVAIIMRRAIAPPFGSEVAGLSPINSLRRLGTDDPSNQ